jgi:DNA repair protein RadC
VSSAGIPNPIAINIERRLIVANIRHSTIRTSKPVYEDIYKGMQMRVCLVREGTADNDLHITSPLDVYNLVKTHVCSSDREVFLSILLTAKKALIGVELVGIGTLDSCLITPREVFKSAILANAASLIIAHYHPSGNTEPSQQDILITRVLMQSGELLCIPVDDHLIIAHDGYKSFKEQGII